ncbi:MULTISPECIES: hypothetical protein [unclassified Shinella]|nr:MULTISPECIES: hypothetical protein [unclassified Shinella]CAI0334822.1 hypothetical protein SHINE37_120158 [Rhizobiaceae bacterium]CAK7260248.1 protein of unknown function [Shinella sp. WSC3-e]
MIYDNKTGALYYEADGSGDAARQQIATLDPGLRLTSADIFVL